MGLTTRQKIILAIVVVGIVFMMYITGSLDDRCLRGRSTC